MSVGRLTGHVEKRRKNSWLLVAEFPPDESGRRKRVTRSVKVDTKKEANAELRRWLAYLEETQVVPDRSTVNEWLERWLRDYVALRCKPRTLRRYEVACRCHIAQGLGNKRLQALSAADIQRWLASMQDAATMEPATQARAFEVLRNSLNDAVKAGLLAFNPCLRCSPPRSRQRPVEVISLEDLVILLRQAPKDFAALIATGALTGMRLGELLGLRWKDVNLEKAELQIENALNAEGGYQLTQTKRDKPRQIAFPRLLTPVLRSHRKWQAEQRLKQGQNWHDLDLVFPREDGYYLHPSTVYHKLQRLCLRTLNKRYHPHLLRHTHATLLLSLGINPAIVAEHLGHADPSTVLKIYAHLLPSTDRHAADVLDALFREIWQE